ncbi:hypothetical protein ILUMI_18486 [Ignelater luminosus]|uniref:acid phosphatase n=1 Tax=Ignelater luminosus TaxID=2038154 RepID=A0A8K0CM01_IGNLU|nr:hypothetical protein ILUMI_18486 [Ignelater luminosus]
MFYLEYYFLWLTLSVACGNALLPANSNCDIENTTVRMVQVLFRHGDRANDVATVYPNDPYINETYEPYGIGQLTNAGKQREFMIGGYLFEKYYSLLQGLCKVNEIEAISTDMSRTKMSLLLVLAGLCPSRGTVFDWNKWLNWQPIPYNYIPFGQDNLLTIPLFYCPNYIKLYNNYLESPPGKQIQEKYKDLYLYLTRHTGMTINSTLDVMLIYFGLYCEVSYPIKRIFIIC